MDLVHLEYKACVSNKLVRIWNLCVKNWTKKECWILDLNFGLLRVQTNLGLRVQIG